MLNLGYLI